MANSFKTEQELFWASEFGGNYTDRNITKHMIASQITREILPEKYWINIAT